MHSPQHQTPSLDAAWHILFNAKGLGFRGLGFRVLGLMADSESGLLGIPSINVIIRCRGGLFSTMPSSSVSQVLG